MSIGNPASKLEPWQERLVLEYKELSTRIEKLKSYLEKNPVTEETSDYDTKTIQLLYKQLKPMVQYQNILKERLEHHGIFPD